MAENENEQDGKVPMSVIDKFLTLNEANNKAYSEIVGVLDTLSANILDMRNNVHNLSDQVADEQLGEVIQLCTDNIQTQVDTVVGLIESINGNHCSIRDSELIKAVEDCLKFQGIEANVFAKSIVDHLQSPISRKDNLETVQWMIRKAGGIKDNWGKLMLLCGATVTFIYLNGGKSIMDLISKFK